MRSAIAWMEMGVIPTFLIRLGIRKLLETRLKMCEQEKQTGQMDAFLQSLNEGPIAKVPEKANEQHYELPPEFFQLVLGPHRKYSSLYYPSAESTLAEAEEAMLQLTCERADLQDGQEILELGCGWGSLTLWMAKQYPNSPITAVSNSTSQRLEIEKLAHHRGLKNVTVITADMNEFHTEKTFDRIVSVEMFEHMHNYRELMRRVAAWLKPNGKLFLHIFCHREYTYPFNTEHPDDWMGKYFFSGGLMPSELLPQRFTDQLELIKHWRVNGKHYAYSARHWIQQMETHRAELLPLLEQHYGKTEAKRWFIRWKVFFLACEELFSYHQGEEWYVSHMLFQKGAHGQ
ncbi:MAG: cyclopropane-fatty-acyl-phospholipid synthase family protein [bacterium]|nr:cyclopropane-fatty-acyl-phospholipid synthase family protein [bacterium]